MATDYEAAYLPGWACDRIDRLRETVEQLRAALRQAETERDKERDRADLFERNARMAYACIMRTQTSDDCLISDKAANDMLTCRVNISMALDVVGRLYPE